MGRFRNCANNLPALLSTGTDVNEKRSEDKLSKATRDCSRSTIELIHGLMAQIVKDKLFNKVGLGK